MKILMGCLIVVGALLLAGCGGSSGPERMGAKIEAGGTPNPLGELWREWGVSSKLGLTNSEHLSVGVITPPEWFSSGPSCRILRVTDGTRWDWQYLVFMRKSGHWRFAGNIDLSMQKYEEPVHGFVEVAPGVMCLTLRELSCSGTGCLLYEDVWYEWNEGCVREVLRYPVEGHVIGWGMPFGRTFEAKVVRERGRRKDGLSVAVTMRVEYSREREDDESVPMFGKAGVAVFAWDPVGRLFRPDVGRSGIGTNELYGVWNDGTAQFALRHLERLTQILATGTKGEREWARAVLDAARGASE